jgi:hypothetical protein
LPDFPHSIRKDLPSMIRQPHITGNAQRGKPEGATQRGVARRGFAPMEKWMIWAVFCLLVGLSSHLIVFPVRAGKSWSGAALACCRGFPGRFRHDVLADFSLRTFL